MPRANCPLAVGVPGAACCLLSRHSESGDCAPAAGCGTPPRPPPRRHGRPPSPQCWLSAERGSEGQSLSLGISLSGGDRMKFFCGARSCAFNHLTAISRLPPLPQVLVRQRAVHETAPSSSPSSQQAGGGVGWCPQGVWAP